MKNGQPFLDTSGAPIHAHGGWMLDAGGYTYWYGEDRRGEEFWYVGDRWMGGEPAYFDSTYVVLPIRFDGDGNPSIAYEDTPALFNG